MKLHQWLVNYQFVRWEKKYFWKKDQVVRVRRIQAKLRFQLAIFIWQYLSIIMLLLPITVKPVTHRVALGRSLRLILGGGPFEIKPIASDRAWSEDSRKVCHGVDEFEFYEIIALEAVKWEFLLFRYNYKKEIRKKLRSFRKVWGQNWLIRWHSCKSFSLPIGSLFLISWLYTCTICLNAPNPNDLVFFQKLFFSTHKLVTS